jgi:hypothetical protein
VVRIAVLTMQMSVPQKEIYVRPPGLPRFCQDLDEHVSAIPDVLSVGAVALLPFEENPADRKCFTTCGRSIAHGSIELQREGPVATSK